MSKIFEKKPRSRTKAFIKPFGTPQRSVKIKLIFILLKLSKMYGTGMVKRLFFCDPKCNRISSFDVKKGFEKYEPNSNTISIFWQKKSIGAH